MDALAVAIGAGIGGKDLKPFYIFRASLSFGFFQFFMPCIGWFLGESFASYISAFDHWAAFALLFVIGAKMIADGASGEERLATNILSLRALFAVSIATSIDALAVGVSVSVVGGDVIVSATMFGVVAFGVSLIGFEFGKALGKRFEKSSLILGGLVLIGIGVKTLFDHMA
jgi:putative Mn2+ efflux pump MntP